MTALSGLRALVTGGGSGEPAPAERLGPVDRIADILERHGLLRPDAVISKGERVDGRRETSEIG